jgi:hypothetical protein
MLDYNNTCIFVSGFIWGIFFTSLGAGASILGVLWLGICAASFSIVNILNLNKQKGGYNG